MAAGDLTTLPYVQGYMNDTTAATEAALPALISAASAFVAQFCSRNFYIATYTSEAYNGSGNAQLILRNQPVTAVSAVSIQGQSVPASSGVNAFGYLFDTMGVWLRCAIFPKTIKGILVTYSAGVAATADTMPADLQECIAMMCNIRRKRVAQEDKNSIGMESQSTSFVTSELTPMVRAILNQYKPPFVASP